MSLSICRAWVSLVAGVRRFLAPLLLCCLALHARADVVALGTVSQVSGSDTLVLNDVPAGNNRVLIVTVSHADVNFANTATLDTYRVRLGAQQMTRANFVVDFPGQARAYDSIWYLALGTSASPGTGTITVTRPAGVSLPNALVTARVYGNVNQTTPTSSPQSLSVSGFNSTLNMTSAAGDMVFDLIDGFTYSTSNPVTATAGGGQTVIASQSVTFPGGFAMYSGSGGYKTSTKAGGAGLVSMSWTGNSELISHLGVNIQQAITPALSVSLTANAAATTPGWLQGSSQGDGFTITASNVSGASTAGTVSLAMPIPAGFLLSGAVYGIDWDCLASTPNRLSCTTATTKAVGQSWSNIQADIAVASSATPGSGNPANTFTATLSGGGAVSNATSASTPTVVQVATRFSVSASTSQTAGSAFNALVTALDGASNTVSGYAGTVHLTSSDGAAVLPSDATLTNGAGVFSVTLRTAGPHTITATDTVTSSITGASGVITVGPGAGAALAFVQQPTNAVSQATIAPAPAVSIIDAFGNQTTSTTSVALAIGTNPGGGALSGTATVGAIGGVATFSGLSIDRAGTGYTLTASAAGLAGATSAAFNISAGAPATMTANAGTTPQSAAINAAFAAPLAVTVRDGGSNPLSGVNVTFTAPGSGASGRFSTVATSITVATNASGVASAPFTANGAAGGPYNVVASASSLSDVNFAVTNSRGSQAISITSPPPGNARKGGATYTPAATATSSLAVAFAVAPASSAVCALAAGVVSFLRPGRCTINADQAGNANYFAAPQVQQTFYVRPGPAHDFDADAMSDILLRDAAGNVSALFVANAALAGIAPVGQAPANWTIQGTADFNGDGKSDILWRETGGQTAIWFMDGATVTSPPLFANLTPNWTIAGTGDFNGDGSTDILWREANGALAIWLLDGVTTLGSQIVASAPPGWTIAGVGDFDGDGKSDILWRHTSGLMAAWFMDGMTIAASPLVGNVSTNWTVAGVGDFNNDGKADILWREDNGAIAVWLLDNFVVLDGQIVGAAPAGWTIHGAGDFNNDGKTDVIWRGPAGEVALWIMDGTTLVAGPQISAAPLTTVIQPMAQ